MTDAFLRPCPACARHARVSEEACPFCGEGFTESFRAALRPRPPGGRLTRAALFAVGAGGLVAASACGSGASGNVLYGAPPATDDGGVSAPVDASGDAPVDGAPDSPATDLVDGGNYAVPYGLPPH